MLWFIEITLFRFSSTSESSFIFSSFYYYIIKLRLLLTLKLWMPESDSIFSFYIRSSNNIPFFKWPLISGKLGTSDILFLYGISSYLIIVSLKVELLTLLILTSIDLNFFYFSFPFPFLSILIFYIPTEVCSCIGSL